MRAFFGVDGGGGLRFGFASRREIFKEHNDDKQVSHCLEME